MSTEHQTTTETKLRRIAWLSSRAKDKVFHQLMPHFNVDSLRLCYQELDGRKATGADGVTKQQYGDDLGNNLEALITRMRRMGYHPSAVREVRIPKAGTSSDTRPLGISNFEDKIVQRQMQKVLESIYEPIFLECSYGFRPGIGCHDAIRALYQYLYSEPVEVVIDVDIKNYFGSLCHAELLELLQRKIKDKRFLRYISRMLKSGILREGELSMSEEGVPQGSCSSPILANIYAHTVIDEWFETVVKQHCRGKVSLFRYCDDMVICCQFPNDAERVQRALEKRLAKYKLKLNVEKTEIVSFARHRQRCGERQGTFDFLGFTFYLGKSRRGIITPRIKTSQHRLRDKLKQLKMWLKMNRSKLSLGELWKQLKVKLLGHMKYFGVSYNTKGIHRFRIEAIRMVFKRLNRRSQRRAMDWKRFQAFEAKYPLPKVQIYHKLF